MATKLQRAVSILNALTDPATVTNALAGRVANAFVVTWQPDIDPATLTNEQKAGLFILNLRNHIKSVVRDAEISIAMTTAKQQTAPGAEVDLGTDGG